MKGKPATSAHLLFSLCIVVCFSACRHGSDATPQPLSFYLVTEDKIEGGRFIDTPGFPKLGYIAPKPNLVITELQGVEPDTYRQKDTMIDKDGKETVYPMIEEPALKITMRPTDAKKFSELTQQAIGKRTLVMLGDTPLMAPIVREPILTESLLLRLGDSTDTNRIERALKKLVK